MIKRHLIFLFLIFVVPHALHAYSQQTISYKINAQLHPDLHRVSGTMALTYYNNSADTLNELFFHQYLNKYQDEEKNRYASSEIILLQDEQNIDVPFSQFGTVLKCTPARKILPGDSIKLNIRFRSILPQAESRYGFYGDHFDVGNWYPVLAVYDAGGWQIDQHDDGEFYQEWGNYDVHLTVPAGYVVAATGDLQNPEVLPDSVTESRKYKYIDPDGAPDITYHFIAKKVHDFAWSADPEFILRQVESCGTNIQFFILPYRLKTWEKHIESAAAAFELFSEKIGGYPYPQLSIVDGYVTAGGIEYPNLVIINDFITDDVDLAATIIHEMAHQWFYGLLANNQTRDGWLDEGFATYYENLAIAEILKVETEYIPSPSGYWGKYFGYDYYPLQRGKQDFLSYLRSDGGEPVDRHYDWYIGDPYIHYYEKMDLVIKQLQYVLGDSLFSQGVKNYFREWKFKHPQPADFIHVFEKTANRDLDWFFYEWLETAWECDYQLKDWSVLKNTFTDSVKYLLKVDLQRNGKIRMPVDLRLTFEDNTQKDVRIPLMEGQNYIDPENHSIDAWPYKSEVFQAEIETTQKVKAVVLNPEGKLFDYHPLNDQGSIIPKIKFHWLNRQYINPLPDHYTLTLFPSLNYSRPTGMQIGLKSRGSYIYPDWQTRCELLIPTQNTDLQADFWFKHPLRKFDKNVNMSGKLFQIAGRRGAGFRLEYVKEQRGKFYSCSAGLEYRNVFDANYMAERISKGNLSEFQLKFKKGFWENGYLPGGWQIESKFTTSFLTDKFKYDEWGVRGKTRVPLKGDYKISAEIFSGGFSGTVPLQKKFRLNGARAYDLISHPLLRSRGGLPDAWWKNGHIFHPGEASLRSLNKLAPQTGKYLLSGAGRLHLANPLHQSLNYIPVLFDFELSAYTAWASSADVWGEFRDYYGEAGISLTFSRLPFLFYYFDIQQIHFDFPLWENDRVKENGPLTDWVIRFDIGSFY